MLFGITWGLIDVNPPDPECTLWCRCDCYSRIISMFDGDFISLQLLPFEWLKMSNKNTHKNATQFSPVIRYFWWDLMFSVRYRFSCCCTIYIDTVSYCGWQWNSALCLTITTTFRSEIIRSHSPTTQTNTNPNRFNCYWKYT